MHTRKALFVFAVLIVVFTLVACQPAVATAALTVTPNITPTPPEPPTPTPYPAEITDPKSVPMVLVPAGEFLMGIDADDALAECEKYHTYCPYQLYMNEESPHTVYLDAFYIDKYEVTNGLYAACVQAGICQPPKDASSYTRTSYYGNPQYEDYPVIHVDWNMAEAYCEWRGARLPTEAEWEKAARGTDGRTYPSEYGLECSLPFNLEDYDGCMYDTSPVGINESGRSFYGAYDMDGNVWEWVADWYSETYYAGSPYENPPGPEAGQDHVMRGGSWLHEIDMDSSYNPWFYPSIADLLGFRCARSP
jgi:formylglycine-generating enzyme required for sulfatase activity